MFLRNAIVGAVLAAMGAPVWAADLQAEDQTPTGKFTTATEIKPIMAATQGSWVAVRAYEGQDWVYVTHLWAWRCGLVQIEFAVNGTPLEVWPMPACHEGTATPNAIVEGDGFPVRTFALKSVETVEIRVTYDDLTTESAAFERAAVLLP